MSKLKALEADLTTALERLREVLDLPKDAIIRDSAIQRFEMSFELAWKYLKALLEEEYNERCTAPRMCFRAAFKHGLIKDDPFWIDLTKLRNYTAHTYNEVLADYVYERLPEAEVRFRSLLAAGKTSG